MFEHKEKNPFNPTAEDEYWRKHYTEEPYYEQGYAYEDYEGAYRTGYEGYGRRCETGKGYDECEAELRREEVVVEKKAHLREEVRARKKTETEREQVQEQVRREDIEVEEKGQTRGRGPRQPTPAETMREREEQPRSMRRHKP